MKISVIGSGYVGIVTGMCFAELGNDVIFVDVDQKKIDLINSGKAPIYEAECPVFSRFPRMVIQILQQNICVMCTG